MSIYFSDQSWLKLKEAVENNTLIILPIGQTEEHGMHLPVKTDAFIAGEVAKKVAEKIRNQLPVLVMPTIWSGYSMKAVSKWPGTIRLKPETFINMVFDVCGSLIEMEFKKIVLISAHGNHTGMLRTVVRKVADEYSIYMALTFPVLMAKEKFKKISKAGKGGSCHAGEYETSLMLYLAEDLVDMSKATSEDKLTYFSKFYPDKVFWSTWGVQRSKVGVYGDPTVATRETGKRIMEATVENYVEFIGEFYNFQPKK